MLATRMTPANVPTMSPSKSWPYFDPEYDTMSSLIDPPRVVIDNEACEDATVVKVNSQNKHGILLEVVQELMDMELTISKARITSDGGWFMDVFYVTDQKGNKLRDVKLIENIQTALMSQKKKWSAEFQKCPGRCVGTQSIAEHTAIELSGTDRPGLISEVSAVLTEMNCRVNAAEVWTHNRRVACVFYVTDEDTLGPIENVRKLERIKEKLLPIMQGCEHGKVARSDIADGFTHVERRLHQLMLADQDYDHTEQRTTYTTNACGNEKSQISVQFGRDVQRNYSVITIKCPDRPKLLFDTVCTLTDLKYVVFHGGIDCSGPFALQEYSFRTMDGQLLDAEAEQKAKKYIEAAIERRCSEGLRLEICTGDRVGLLADVTRKFREYGMSVTKADVSTQGDMAVNIFYVTDNEGQPVDTKTVDAMRREDPILRGVKTVVSKVNTNTNTNAGASRDVVDGASRFSNFMQSTERFFQGFTTSWKMPTVV